MQKSPDKLIILCVHFRASSQLRFEGFDVSAKDSLVN